MIDLHCHMLPGIDDGSPDIETSLRMARIACDDGITHTACTPHIYPGVYDNTAAGIAAATEHLQQQLNAANLPLQLTFGADTHVGPHVLGGIQAGTIPTLAHSRYILLEPSHHVAPPHFKDHVFALLAHGYVPVITHPERLRWIEEHYEMFLDIARGGAWLQLTAGSLTGRFGSQARYWSDRLLDEGWVHILATDAHGVERRPPILSEGVTAAARWVGAEEARRMVEDRPRAILENRPPQEVRAPKALSGDVAQAPRRRGLLQRLFG